MDVEHIFLYCNFSRKDIADFHMFKLFVFDECGAHKFHVLNINCASFLAVLYSSDDLLVSVSELLSLFDLSSNELKVVYKIFGIIKEHFVLSRAIPNPKILYRYGEILGFEDSLIDEAYKLLKIFDSCGKVYSLNVRCAGVLYFVSSKIDWKSQHDIAKVCFISDVSIRNVYKFIVEEMSKKENPLLIRVRR